jgi:hypothetical protein
MDGMSRMDNLDKLGLFFMFLFIITVIIGMLNILIAQLWASYAKVAHDKVQAVSNLWFLC